MSSESLGNSIMTRGHECLRLLVFLEINKHMGQIILCYVIYLYNLIFVYVSYFLQNILNIIQHNFNYILSLSIILCVEALN